MVMDYAEDTAPTDSAGQAVDPSQGGHQDVPPDRLKLVKEWCEKVKSAKSRQSRVWKRMREDQQLAFYGADAGWVKADRYIANITAQHVNQRVAALYAKDPTIVAKRRQTMDFQVWDENPQTLLMAFQQIQQAQMAAQQFAAMGAPPPPGAAVPSQQAMAVIQDFQQGLQRRQMLDKVGKTLELVADYYQREQNPPMKVSMKQAVRRAQTNGVAFVKLGFKRTINPPLDPMNPQQPSPGGMDAPAPGQPTGDPMTLGLDQSSQLAHLAGMAQGADGSDLLNPAMPNHGAQAEMLSLGINSLTQAPQAVVREGLIYDFPAANKVICDPLTKHLRGFVGARWVAHEMDLTPEQVMEVYGVDLKKGGFTEYNAAGRATNSQDSIDDAQTWMQYDGSVVTSWDGNANQSDPCLARIWEVYDKETGVQLTICDGHPNTLEEPGPPKVSVSTFWPLFALTFNETEHDTELYPPSDVALMRHMQLDYNRNRQGMREHKHASRPRYVVPRGKVTDEDVGKITDPAANTILELDAVQPGEKVSDLFQPFPATGVDPNLYETATIFTDLQLVVGSSQEDFGMPSKQTATSSSIAEGARQTATGSHADDLDDFLSAIARAAGEILLANMSVPEVQRIAGMGSVWPEFSQEDISGEIYLEVAAGSSGKPNKALEISNMREVLPYLIQLPGIDPTWLARQILDRMDDHLDLTEAFAQGVPSIVAQNAMARAAPPPGAPGQPGGQPEDQGAQGGQNAQRNQQAPGGPPAPMGNNQV